MNYVSVLDESKAGGRGSVSRAALFSQHLDFHIFQTDLKTTRQLRSFEHPPCQKLFVAVFCCVFSVTLQLPPWLRQKEGVTDASETAEETKQEATVSVAMAPSHRFIFVCFCLLQMFSLGYIQDGRQKKRK